MVQKIILGLALSISWAAPLYSAEADSTLRICLLQDVPSFSLRVKGSFEIHGLNNKKLIYKGKSLKKQRVKIRNNKIDIQGILSDASALQIMPLKGSSIYINNRIFRGKLNLVLKPKARILVVNELGMEDYLRGILGQEVAPWWPMEALKAQAITARSYALYHKQFSRDKDFDLTSDIYSQVYGGKSSERWRTNRAVDLTKGKILVFEGKLFPAYYHATCSGSTEDASQLWNIDLAPLKGVLCPFCLHSPHYKWQAKIPLEDIKSKLIARGFQIQEISGIKILGYNSSGRITELEIKAQDKSLIVRAKDLRQALGPNLIRSLSFTLRLDSGVVNFEGLGWGHGVGLCQWGMHAMAQKGHKYEQILQYYFPQSISTLISLISK